MRLSWLAGVLRNAGLDVIEVPGWQTRGADLGDVAVVIGHHTATSAKATGDMPTLRMLVDGRGEPTDPDYLPGPLSQLGLGRSGTCYVVAAGKANHAGKGAWTGIQASNRTIGIEAEHPGDNSPWPAQQLDAYDRLIAALLRRLGYPATSYCGHREWALPPGRKPDPRGIDLHAQRTRVAELLRPVTPPTPILEDWMPVIAKAKGAPTVYLTDLLTAKRSLDSQAEVTMLKAAGIRDVGEVDPTLLADVPTVAG